MYNLGNQKNCFTPQCVTLVYTFKRSLTSYKLWSTVKYNGDNIFSQENDNIAINMLSVDTKFIIRLRKDILLTYQLMSRLHLRLEVINLNFDNYINTERIGEKIFNIKI